MAELEKFTDAGVAILLKHSDRQLKNDSNKDIIEEKSDLNYSIDIANNGLSPKQYYKQLKDDSYIYGRGTQREADAVTCCSWIVTLPKSVSDYDTVGKNEIKIINPDAEKAFFEAANQFVSNRYGTVFYNRIHYDEGGQPHIHIYFVPQTKLDHDLVHYKTAKTHQAVRTDTGRYEFLHRFKLQNGEKIPLKNYAKMSDYYDAKISAADVLNKAELQHFHGDFANYLRRNNIPGADSVYTGKTDGKNLSVKSLKEFTQKTGITIEELKEHPLPKDELTELLDKTELKPSVKIKIEAINNEVLVDRLQAQLQEYKTEISQQNQLNTHTNTAINTEKMELEKKVADLKKSLDLKQEELNRANARIEELERTKSVEATRADIDQGWGHSQTSGWGDKQQSGWGNSSHTRDEEKLW